MPVNFSRTDLEPTHIISADAILAITLVTYHKQTNFTSNVDFKNNPQIYSYSFTYLSHETHKQNDATYIGMTHWTPKKAIWKPDNALATLEYREKNAWQILHSLYTYDTNTTQLDLRFNHLRSAPWIIFQIRSNARSLHMSESFIYFCIMDVHVSLGLSLLLAWLRLIYCPSKEAYVVRVRTILKRFSLIFSKIGATFTISRSLQIFIFSNFTTHQC